MREILLLEILTKTHFKWGINSPHLELPVGREKGPDWPSGRPAGRPANGQIIDRRPPGRPPPESEINGSLAGRPPGRPGQPESGLTSVGRPAKQAGLCARLVHIG